MSPSLLLIFVAAALTVYTLFRIVAPFLEPEEHQLRDELLDEEYRAIEELVARKSILLQTLRDIEFDHDTGKISDEDYERLTAKYEHRAVQVMKELARRRGGVDRDDEIDAEIEKRLENERTDTEVDAATDEQTPPPSDEAAAVDEPGGEWETDTDEATIDCPDCGKELEAEARFCSRCGVALEPEPDGGDSLEEPAATEGDETPGTDVRSEATG